MKTLISKEEAKGVSKWIGKVIIKIVCGIAIGYIAFLVLMAVKA